ncbi:MULTISPECIES: chemotaxis protein CheC [Halomicrobium]|uniref:Chemotaxis protein CheC n=1 Tax=Halomicrobium mukohataei TaxID=57705 RepID=A0A847UA37_9EURY|nr:MULTISPECIES: chemotaxis protein CheC [Halomicrobium]MBO4247624.1 chemotaxis protein CheC [Halomicrobium sp. IBSBa]NLV09107.1 chemotaxis protein CheC [Halomicrobium mukohataei]QGA81155.1 Chemotaxis protein CheC, inhibitor of MCP methylation [Halomicrobium sp. LC1Hm]
MSLQVDVRKLDLFNKMAKEGSGTVADHLSQLTGVDASVRTSQINFLDIGDVKTHLGNDERIGIYVELTEAPGGYVLFVLDPDHGKRLAGQMMGGIQGADEGFSQMEESALQEIGNIMTSGFIDGWANVLDATIDMTTPTLLVDDTATIIDSMGGWPDSDLVFVVDSHIVAEGADIDMTVYTFPQLEDLVAMIQDIDLDTDVAEDTTASDLL